MTNEVSLGLIPRSLLRGVSFKARIIMTFTITVKQYKSVIDISWLDLYRILSWIPWSHAPWRVWNQKLSHAFPGQLYAMGTVALMGMDDQGMDGHPAVPCLESGHCIIINVYLMLRQSIEWNDCLFCICLLSKRHLICNKFKLGMPQAAKCRKINDLFHKNRFCNSIPN